MYLMIKPLFQCAPLKGLIESDEELCKVIEITQKSPALTQILRP